MGRSRLSLLLLLLVVSASPHADAVTESSELVPIAPSALRWATGTAAEDSATVSREASGWAAGESARQAALGGADVVWVSVPVPHGDWLAPTLFLEGVSGRVELWMDGKLYPTPQRPEIADMAAVPLPLSAVGKAVQVRLHGVNFTATLSRVSVGQQGRVTEMMLQRGIAASLVGLLMMVIALAALGIWALTERERFLFHVLVFCGVSGMMAFGLGPASPLIAGSWWQMLALYGGVGLFPWATMGMVRAGFPEQSPAWMVWIERLTLAWGAFLLIAKIATDTNSATTLSPVTFSLALGASIFIAVKATRSGHADGRLFLGGLAVFFAIVVYDFLGLMGVRDVTGFHVHWGLLVMTSAFVGMFARRMAQAAALLRIQTKALEAREKEGSAITKRLLSDANELLAAVAQLRLRFGSE